MSPHTDAGALADKIDRRFDAYLNSLEGGQNQAVNEVALRNALWDNKAGIIAHLRQAASHGSAGGERTEVRSVSVEDISLTPEQLSITNDMIHAWIDEPERYRIAFRNDCKRLLATVLNGAAQEAKPCGDQSHDSRVYFMCQSCEEHNPEGAVGPRSDIAVMPDGTWLCDGCYSDCDKSAYGLIASEVDDFVFPRFEDLPRPAPYGAPSVPSAEGNSHD